MSVASRTVESTQRLLHTAYEQVKTIVKRDAMAGESAQAIYNLVMLSLTFLQAECVVVNLISKVPTKEYVSYARPDINNVLSRPANNHFFTHDATYIGDQWDRWLRDDISQDDFARMTYTVALAPCLAMELFDRQNKKGPATYFECMIGHIFAKLLGKNPRKQAVLPVHGRQVRLTMDFLFEITDALTVHLPVKMSTRERVVQAWGHQRLLDAAYGDRFYRGIMVLFAETKLAITSRQVTEICVPDQWLAYQVLLSKLERIYYFDIPARYYALTTMFPDIIQIK
jgi:hypothetical protein